MTSLAWPVSDLLPHSGPAVLLDEVLDLWEDGLSGRVTISAGCAFHQENGVPAHVGIEYMAQACGAFSGAMARRAGETPRMGYLLGTRRYLATRAWFVDGERLIVTSRLVYRDAEMAMFDCVITSDGDAIATARLMVAEPAIAAAVPRG